MVRIKNYCGLVFLAVVLPLSAQIRKSEPPKALDPMALTLLKAVTDPIRNAKAYSFRTQTTREILGTNGQVVTQFSENRITVTRPASLKMDILGRGSDVELFFHDGATILYSPDKNVYSVFSSPKTIDAAMDALEKKEVFLPVRNFLVSDPYASLAPDLRTAYIVGQTEVEGQTVHQLAFTERGADWQLWVVGGAQPRIRRLQVIDTSKPHRPRTSIDFFDWDFSVATTPKTFSFQKPADAKQIEFIPQGLER